MLCYTEHTKQHITINTKKQQLASTCSPETLDSSGETFGSGQQVVFQFRQPLGFSYLHTDTMLGLCKTSSFTVQEKLVQRDKRQEQGHSDIKRNQAIYCKINIHPRIHTRFHCLIWSSSIMHKHHLTIGLQLYLILTTLVQNLRRQKVSAVIPKTFI